MSHHIWTMRESDINDNLVTFSAMQHIRLKIKQEKKKIFLISSKAFSFFFLIPERTAVFGSAVNYYWQGFVGN